MLGGFSYSSYLLLFLIVSQVSQKPSTLAGMLEQCAYFLKALAENWPAVGL